VTLAPGSTAKTNVLSNKCAANVDQPAKGFGGLAGSVGDGKADRTSPSIEAEDTLVEVCAPRCRYFNVRYVVIGFDGSQDVLHIVDRVPPFQTHNNVHFFHVVVNLHC
jgi:hypothetical protein